MLLYVNGKVKTEEQIVNKAYNKYVSEYNNYKNEKEKKRIISDLISEIEYFNSFSDEDERDKAVNELIKNYDYKEVFSEMEFLTILSIIESMDIRRN